MKREEVIFAGLGGQGVLTAALLLAEAAFLQYKHVLYFPAYTTAMRGGASESTVIFSDEEIPSPLVDEVGTLVILDSSQLKTFRTRVRVGGLIVLESYKLQEEVQRKDIKVLKIPGRELAANSGAVLAANQALLGAYIGATKVLPPECIEEQLSKRFAGKQAALAKNREIFRQGLDLGSKLMLN